MNFTPVAMLALLGVSAGGPTLSLHLQRTSLDVLDVIGIQLVVDNRASKPVPLRFGAAQEYVVSIRPSKDIAPVFTLPQQTPPPGVVIAGHVRALQPGANVLATYEWNELTDAHTAIAPGRYTIEVRALTNPELTAHTDVTFVAPVPVSAIEKLKLSDVITIAGRLDASGSTLTDATGSIALSKHLSAAAGATIAVRGSIAIDPQRGTRGILVERWAPLP